MRLNVVGVDSPLSQSHLGKLQGSTHAWLKRRITTRKGNEDTQKREANQCDNIQEYNLLKQYSGI